MRRIFTEDENENERDKLSILPMAVLRPFSLPGAKLLVLLRAGSSITRAYFWQVDSERISGAPLECVQLHRSNS